MTVLPLPFAFPLPFPLLDDDVDAVDVLDVVSLGGSTPLTTVLAMRLRR